MPDRVKTRVDKRRESRRRNSVERALKVLTDATANLDLSASYRQKLAGDVAAASRPLRRAKDIVADLPVAVARSRPTNEPSALEAAMQLLDDCPDFRKRRAQRQDAIRRVVRAADKEHGAALACAERIVNGDHWRGMTWLPEVKDGYIRPKANRREYVRLTAETHTSECLVDRKAA